MESFWAAFWPNLASTVVGVGIGVPVGLWLNRVAERAADEKRRHVETESLRHGLAAVIEAVEHNRARLSSLVSVLQANQALFDLGLDTAAWDSARDQVIPLLRDPQLQRRMAFYFDRLKALARSSSMYLETVVGVTSALGGVHQTRDSLKRHLLETATDLLQQGDIIKAAAREAMPKEIPSA